MWKRKQVVLQERCHQGLNRKEALDMKTDKRNKYSSDDTERTWQVLDMEDKQSSAKNEERLLGWEEGGATTKRQDTEVATSLDADNSSSHALFRRQNHK